MATVAHEVRAKVDPNQAYKAVSTQEGFRGWWTRASKVDPKVGGEAEFRFSQGGAAMTFRFDELKPGKSVKMTCVRTNDQPGGHVDNWVGTVLEFEIEPAGGETVVRLRHGGVPGESLAQTQKGWGHFGASLKQYFETGTGTPDAGS